MSRTSISPVTYLLRNPKSKVATPINCIIRFDNQRINVGTGFKVYPIHWSTTKQRVKNVVEAINKDMINSFLEELANVVSSFIMESRAKRLPLTKDLVKGRVKEHLNPNSQSDKTDNLIDFAEQYILSSPTRIIRGSQARTGRLVSPDTIRRYRTTLNGLKSFSATYNRQLTFENIDQPFYVAFTTWLTAKNYATNNVSKYIENVKGFMNAAVDEGYTTNLAFRKFNNLREEVENVYLTESELSKIYHLDLNNSNKLERVRDLFIFAAWTGLRFSDFSNLQPENIKRNEEGKLHFDLRQRKTNNRVVIPVMNNAVVEILEKYGNNLPKSISNQKTNNYIKEICKLAEINTKILKHATKGGKTLVKNIDGWSNISSGVEKWTLVTTHTARRSFATNMYKRKLPTSLIMRLTGHQKEIEFKKYIRIEYEETLSLVRNYMNDNGFDS
jgi:integrase